MPDNQTITLESAGGHQEIHIGKFRADRRGLVSGSVQRHIREAHDAPPDFSYLRVSAAPPTDIPCVGVEREYSRPHGIYTYSYEGIAAEVDDDALATFELDITMEEVSIEAHPNLAKIEAKYGRFDPRLRRFTQKFLSTGGEDDPLNGDGAEKRKRNPLFGTDSYLSFGATFKKSYVRRAIPARALRGIGTIIARPIGVADFQLPKAARHRKWLKLAPRIVKRGNSVQIDENYIMSGRHGIVKEIYGAAQLEEESDDGESAL